MSTFIHFINVGQGNMNLLICDNGAVILYDCNITDNNRNSVFAYLRKIMPKNSIDVFVNSHRDCDHMRNIQEVHQVYPIGKIWDSGQYGTSPQDATYQAYMRLKRNVSSEELTSKQSWNAGTTKIQCLNGWRDGTSDANSQSIVLRVQHGTGSSMILTGDSDAVAWKNRILRSFAKENLKSNILLASHHGSISFFDDPSDEENYYTQHIQAIKPEMTIISVGRNVHGHPDSKSVELYKKYSAGSNKGNKLRRTDEDGNIVLELKNEGGWSLSCNQ